MVHSPERVRRDTVRWRGGWVRLGTWRGQDDVAQITVAASAPAPARVVDQCIDQLRSSGFRAVYTSALLPDDCQPFLANGFAVHEQLHLLEHDLAAIPTVTYRTRRARPADHPAVLHVDRQGFDDFWRFDRSDLADALGATPTRRFRLIEHGSQVIGYAITGRASSQGYLQRLAVHPDHRGVGLGTALVADGLRWLRRRGARRALVNTQIGNDRAVGLYERCGFTQLPTSLAVLGRSL